MRHFVLYCTYIRVGGGAPAPRGATWVGPSIPRQRVDIFSCTGHSHQRGLSVYSPLLQNIYFATQKVGRGSGNSGRGRTADGGRKVRDGGVAVAPPLPNPSLSSPAVVWESEARVSCGRRAANGHAALASVQPRGFCGGPLAPSPRAPLNWHHYYSGRLMDRPWVGWTIEPPPAGVPELPCDQGLHRHGLASATGAITISRAVIGAQRSMSN